jgi:hypothetical protein
MKIKRFESKEEKVKDQEVLFTAKSLEKDKEEKPSFKTEVEDNEKVQKEFKKSMDKIEKFENFTIEIEVKTEEEESEEEIQEVGCGCGEDCQCGKTEDYCDSCDRVSSQCVCDESNPESDVKVMSIEDFISSLNK